MRVLSLFDGISCGRVALERAGIDITTYIASEVDKYALKVSRENYPDIVQLGDVKNVAAMVSQGLLGKIDLLIGGSPCQGFSFAGKQLAFDDPRSVLFFEFVEVLKAARAINPDMKFMLENVRMKKEHLSVITEIIGVEPVCINSALVSAQNRVRYYWCNWLVSQPADRGIMLRDVLESNDTDKTKSRTIRTGGLTSPPEARQNWATIGVIKDRDELKLRNDKAMCLDANYHKGADNHGQRRFVARVANVNPSGRGMNGWVFDPDAGLAPTITTNKGEGSKIMTGAAIRGREETVLEVRKDEKSNSLLADGHQSRLVVVSQYPRGKNAGFNKAMDKCPTLSASRQEQNLKVNYRKLTPVECERLQGLPDNYTRAVSATQRYKCLGNGWQVDTVEHIFREMQK